MQIVIRTEQIRLSEKHTIGEWCHKAKNLYNNANYTIRNELDESNNWIRYHELDKIMKNMEEQFNDYSRLPAQTAQQILMKLDKNWKSFFKAIEDFKIRPEKYKSMPKPPKYLKKNGETMLTFTNQQCKIKNGLLKFPNMISLEVKTRLTDETKLKEVRIKPVGVGYTLEIVYEKEVSEPKKKSENITGIDIGVSNLVTLVDNIGDKPIIVKGGKIKSINQFYNKKKAKLQSVYDHQKIKFGNKLNRLTDKRNKKVKDYFHKASRIIVDWCNEHNIDTIVIGHNNDWKQNVNIGKRNNQKFVQIPFNDLIHMISYKAEEFGIKTVIQEESHTSRCSFLDDEQIIHHDYYMGKRIKRGLFRTKNKTLINADVNGAYNILKKAFPKAFVDGIEGVGLHPIRLSI